MNQATLQHRLDIVLNTEKLTEQVAFFTIIVLLL